MLEGKIVNLNIIEREDLSVIKEWDNEIGIMGEYEPISVLLLNFNRALRKCRLKVIWKSDQT